MSPRRRIQCECDGRCRMHEAGQRCLLEQDQLHTVEVKNEDGPATMRMCDRCRACYWYAGGR